MSELDIIKKPVESELKEFEKYFSNILKNDHTIIKHITNLILRKKGKQIRPLLVLLSAKLTGEITEKTYVGAALIELLHTATLVHDDVVDNSDMRRGFFSIKALWHSKIAVLFGDYLLAKGLLISVDTGNFDLLQISSDAVKKMIEGELQQLKRSRNIGANEQDYFKIIENKTATLIAAACAIGAKSATDDTEKINRLHEIGKMIGISFQIKDDLLDLEKDSKSGKTKANDIMENKITLPVIMALNEADQKERREILKVFHKKNKSLKDIQKIIKFINDKNGIKNAYKILEDYKLKSIELLDYFDDNEAKDALIKLIDFITKRNF